MMTHYNTLFVLMCVLQLGLRDARRVPSGPLSMYQFTCPKLNAKKDITLYAHQLHMHKSGARMKTVHYRDGAVVGGSEVEHYDFDYQDMTYRNEIAKAGDSFTTSCWYDHKNRGNEKILFGLGSSDEMCTSPLSIASHAAYCTLPPLPQRVRASHFTPTRCAILVCFLVFCFGFLFWFFVLVLVLVLFSHL